MRKKRVIIYLLSICLVMCHALLSMEGGFEPEIFGDLSPIGNEIYTEDDATEKPLENEPQSKSTTQHDKLANESNDDFSCPIANCQKKYKISLTTLGYLHNHIKKDHPGTPDTVIEKIKESLELLKKDRTSSKNTSQNNYQIQCPANGCTNNFSSKKSIADACSTLKYHISNKHPMIKSGNYSINCPYCNFKYSDQYFESTAQIKLKYHIQQKHPGKQTPEFRIEDFLVDDDDTPTTSTEQTKAPIQENDSEEPQSKKMRINYLLN